MSGKVHFKFRSALSYDTVAFDGHFISVGELKRLIADKKGLGKDVSAELVLSEPRTNVEYTDDTQQVPQNTSVLVRRAPVARPRALQAAAAPLLRPAAVTPAQLDAIPGVQPSAAAAAQPSAPAAAPADVDEFGADPYTQQAQLLQQQYQDEDTRINAIVAGSESAWQQESMAAGGRGRGRGGRGGSMRPPKGARPPPGYVCRKCGSTEHYIYDCPTNNDPNWDGKRVYAPSGIPTTMLARTTEGGLLLPDGGVGTLAPNEAAWSQMVAMMPGQQQLPPPQRAAAATAIGAPQLTAAAGARPAPVAALPAPGDAGRAGAEAAALFDDDTDGPGAAPTAGMGNLKLAHGMSPGGGAAAAEQKQLIVRASTPDGGGGAATAATGAQEADDVMSYFPFLADIMPRGPMAFLIKAFSSDTPLTVAEFQSLQQEHDKGRQPDEETEGSRQQQQRSVRSSSRSRSREPARSKQHARGSRSPSVVHEPRSSRQQRGEYDDQEAAGPRCRSEERSHLDRQEGRQRRERRAADSTTGGRDEQRQSRTRRGEDPSRMQDSDADTDAAAGSKRHRAHADSAKGDHRCCQISSGAQGVMLPRCAAMAIADAHVSHCKRESAAASSRLEPLRHAPARRMHSACARNQVGLHVSLLAAAWHTLSLLRLVLYLMIMSYPLVTAACVVDIIICS